MDTSTLRWILIIAGVIVLASIWLFFNPERKRKLKPKASRRKAQTQGDGERREPTLEGGLAKEEQHADPDLGDAFSAGEPLGQGELAIESTDTPAAPAGPQPDKIVSLFLLARDNHRITGAELLQAMVSSD